MTNGFFLVLLLFFGAAAGCASQPAEPQPTVSTSDPPPRLAELPTIKANEGDRVVYRFGTDYNPAHRVDLDFAFVLRAGLDVSLVYTYPGHPSFDSTMEATVSPEGGWNSTVFPCPHVFPDDRNMKCQTYRGGFGFDTDLDGPFFGYALLAGLPVSEGNAVERPFRVGIRPFTVRFLAEDLGDTVAVSPQDFRAMFLWDVDHAADNPEPVPCTIFSGRIVVEKRTGLPLSCDMVTDEERGFMAPLRAWSRLEHHVTANGPWGFSRASVPSMPPSDGSFRFPARSSDQGLPFGLWEALDAAAEGNAEVKSILEKPSAWLGDFSLFYTSTTTGMCPACVTSVNWFWSIELHDGTNWLAATVTRSDGIVSPHYDVAVDWRKTDSIHPRQFAAGPTPLGTMWDRSAQALGFSPIAIGCQMAEPGDQAAFAEYTGFVEPVCNVSFARPASEGPVSPTISYRSDGSLSIFEANGAVADPLLE